MAKDELASILPREKRFWLSATDLKTRGIWSWMSNGELVRASNWNKGQPDNVNEIERCVTAVGWSDFKWDDIDCTNTAVVVCEKELTIDLCDCTSV